MALQYPPPPCPVDDCPYTSCTAPEEPVQQTVMGGHTYTFEVPVDPLRVFTTGTYRGRDARTGAVKVEARRPR